MSRCGKRRCPILAGLSGLDRNQTGFNGNAVESGLSRGKRDAARTLGHYLREMSVSSSAKTGPSRLEGRGLGGQGSRVPGR